jgi:hypothetical protein
MQANVAEDIRQHFVITFHNVICFSEKAIHKFEKKPKTLSWPIPRNERARVNTKTSMESERWENRRFTLSGKSDLPVRTFDPSGSKT